MSSKEASKDKDKSKIHKLALKGSAKLVAEFVSPAHTPPSCVCVAKLWVANVE